MWPWNYFTTDSKQAEGHTDDDSSQSDDNSKDPSAFARDNEHTTSRRELPQGESVTRSKETLVSSGGTAFQPNQQDCFSSNEVVVDRDHDGTSSTSSSGPNNTETGVRGHEVQGSDVYVPSSESNISVSEDSATDIPKACTAKESEHEISAHPKMNGDDNMTSPTISTEDGKTSDERTTVELGVDDNGEVILSSDLRLDHGYLADDDTIAETLSVYHEKDDTLIESFREPERDSNEVSSQMVSYNKELKGNPQQTIKNRAASLASEFPSGSLALFDILDRDFASAASTGSFGECELTAADLKLCFAAFIFCFTPPSPTHFAVEYNHNLDDQLRHAEVNGSDAMDTLHDVADGGRQNFDQNKSKDYASSKFPRPYVPIHIVNAVFAETLAARCSSEDGNEEACSENVSAQISPAVLSLVRDSLALLGVLDVRKILIGFQDGDCVKDGDNLLQTMNTRCEIGHRSLNSKDSDTAVEVVSVHQNIHQEYGEYLISVQHPDGIEQFLKGCRKRLHQAVVRACSRDLFRSDDLAYALQMLPWNMINAEDYKSAAELLENRRFVHRRLQSLGNLYGTTAHVTDFDELIRCCHRNKSGEVDVSQIHSAMLVAYGQVKNNICRQLKGREERFENSRSNHLKLMQIDAGKSLHVMGVALGAQGYTSEEMSIYEDALKLKREASDDDEPLSVTISDTLHCIGFSLDNVGKYLQAMDYYNEALQLRQRSLGDDDLRVAETLHNKGAILCETGSSDAALACLEEALRIRRLCLGDAHELCADTLQWIGNVMRDGERYDEALDYFKKALQIKKAVLGDDHEDVATSLQNMAVVLDEMAKYSFSLECYKEALRIYRLHFDEESHFVADTLHNIANVFSVTEKHQSALDTFNQVIHVREALLRRESDFSIEQSTAFQDVIVASHEVSSDVWHRYGKLLDCYKEVLHLTQLLKGIDDSTLIAVQHRLGDLYWNLHDWNNSILSYKEALRIQRMDSLTEGPTETEVCNLLQKKGTVHLFRKEYSFAKSCFESVIRRRKGLVKVDQVFDASPLYFLGVASGYLREHKLSLFAFTEALRLWKGIHGEAHVNCGHALHWIGRQDGAMGHHQEALHWYRGALRIYKNNKKVVDSAVVVDTLKRLGDSHKSLGDNVMALKAYKEATRIIRRRYGDAHEALVPALCEMGRLHEAQVDMDDAMSNYEEAVKVMKQMGKRDLCLCSIIEKLGMLQDLQRDHTKAKDTLSEAYRLFNSVAGHDDLMTAGAVYRLGKVLDKLGSHESAMHCYRECLRVQQIGLGLEHQDVAATLVSMGTNFISRNMGASAIECLQEALCMQRRLRGEDAEEASTLHSLGLAYTMSGSFDKAVVCLKEAIRVTKSTPSFDQASVARISFDLALAHEGNGNYHLAVPCYKESLGMRKASQIKLVPITLLNLGNAHVKVGQICEAVEVLSQARSMLQEHQVNDNSALLSDVAGALANCHAASGELDSAIDCYREHIILLKAMPKSEEAIADSLYALGTVQTRNGDLAAAAKDFECCLSMRKACFGTCDERVAKVLLSLSIVHEKLEEYESAKECLREVLNIFQKTGNEKEMSATFEAMGDLLSHQEEFSGAADCFEQALLLRRRADGPKRTPDVASLLHSYGFALMEVKKIEQSLKCFQEALQIRQSKFGASDVEAAHSEYMVGRALLEACHHDEAIKFFAHAKEVFKTSMGIDSLEVGNCSHFTGLAYLHKGDYMTAKHHLSESLPSRERAYGSESLEVAQTCHSLSQASLSMGQCDCALEFAAKALQIRKIQFGDSSVECADSFRQLGAVQEALGRNSKALTCHIESLRAFTAVEGKDNNNAASILLRIGKLYAKVGEYRKANDNLRRALKMYENAGKDDDIARVLLLIGIVESRRGNPDSALEHYKDSLQVSRNHPDVGSVYEEIGAAYVAKGMREKAKTVYDEALQFFEENAGRDSLPYARVLFRMASLLCEEDDYDAALGHFRYCLETFKREFGELSDEVAGALVKIGTIHNHEVDYEEALKCLTAALKIRSNLFGSDDERVAATLFEIGQVLEEWGDSEEAFATYREVIRILTLNPDRGDGTIAEVHSRMGRMYMERAEYDEALRSFHEAYEVGIGAVELAHTLVDIGGVHDATGEADAALASYSEALKVFKAKLGDQDESVALVLNNIGINHARRGDFVKAIELCSEALRIRKMASRNQQLDVADSCLNIAAILDEWGKVEQALKFYSEAMGLYQKNAGDDNIEVANCHQRIGSMLMKLNDQTKAIESLVESVRIYRIKEGTESLNVALSLFLMARIYAKRSEYDEALACFEECLRIRKQELGDQHSDVSTVRRYLDAIQRKM